MTSKIFPASQKRWENRWEMIKKFSDGSSVVGGSTQDADSQKVYNAVDLSIRARHQTDPISSAAVIFDGECLNGIELRMYEGTGDNQGSNEERRARCLQACIDKKTPLNTGNTWIGFVMQGYIVQTNSVKPGRCFCENVKSTETECRRQSMENDFKRYDYVEGAAVSQAIVMSNIGFGTIDMSYTLKRNRKGTCVMKFNQPLFPYNKGIQSQSNQLTKEACAEWCETALTTTVGCEYSNGVCSEMKGPITSQPLYYGTGKEAKYTIESGSDCSALGKAQITTPQECEIAANALSIQIGTMKDWTKTSVPGGCLLEVNAQDADFNANLQSRTQHSDRKLICKNAQPAKEGEWAGWACWMHENNDQKITMGMTTTKGSVCKASDMVDLIHTTDDGNKGASSECKTSGFLLEHTLKAKKEGGLYDQYSKTRLLSGTSLSHAKMTLGQNGKYTYTQSFSVYSGEDANLPDTGPYRVNIVRNGIDGALTIAVNGHTLLISNTPMYVGTSPLQVWFQGDGASQFTVENIQISNRMTNFVTYNTGQVLLDGLGPNAAQSQYKIKFSQLQMPSDARDHLLMIARSPPWRLIEAFQIEDIGCLGRHCNQCKSNQDCLVCEKGWYLHGTLCVANCPEGTRSIFVDQSTAMELNSLANLDKALLKTESVPIDIVQTGMNDIKCLPTHSGTPIMGQGQGGCLAFKMAEKDTYWTSNKPPPASCTHSETSPVANECMCGAATCAANKYCWKDNTCKENAKTADSSTVVDCSQLTDCSSAKSSNGNSNSCRKDSKGGCTGTDDNGVCAAPTTKCTIYPDPASTNSNTPTVDKKFQYVVDSFDCLCNSSNGESWQGDKKIPSARGRLTAFGGDYNLKTCKEAAVDQVKIQWNKLVKTEQDKVEAQGSAATTCKQATEVVVKNMFSKDDFDATSLQVGTTFCCTKGSNTLLRTVKKEEDYDMYNETMLSTGTSVGATTTFVVLALLCSAMVL